MDQFLTYKKANLGPVFNFNIYIYLSLSLSPLRFSKAHMQFTLRPKSASVLSVSNGKHLSTAATHVSKRSATQRRVTHTSPWPNGQELSLSLSPSEIPCLTHVLIIKMISRRGFAYSSSCLIDYDHGVNWQMPKNVCVCFLKSPLLIMSTKCYTSGMFGQEISSTNKAGIMRPSNGLFTRVAHSPFDFLLHSATLAIRWDGSVISRCDLLSPVGGSLNTQSHDCRTTTNKTCFRYCQRSPEVDMDHGEYWRFVTRSRDCRARRTSEHQNT